MQVQISQHIIWNSVKELLYRHDCVIVPGFGGFVCNREQSRIDQVSHVILPPGKRIVFNQNLKTNDGLLAQNIAEKLRISYAEALRSIAELVNQLREQLEQLRQLDIDAFGSFRLNAEANYVFLPERTNSYLHSSFGLFPLQALPVSAAYKGARQTRIFKDRREVREARRIVRVRHIGLKALTVALVTMLCINAYIFLTDANLIGGARLNTTGINSWFDSLMKPKEELRPVASDKPAGEETAPVPEPAVALQEQDSLLIPAEEPAIAYDRAGMNVAEALEATVKNWPYQTVEATAETGETGSGEPAAAEVPVTPAPSLTPARARYSYHVIGGVFCKEKNARNFFNKLKEQGFEAELLLNTRINCNRVSYRKVYSLEEALELMDSLKATTNPEAWVLTQRED